MLHVEEEKAEAAGPPVAHRVGEEGDGGGGGGGGPALDLAWAAEGQLHIGCAPVGAVRVEEEAQGEGVAGGGGAADGEVAGGVAVVSAEVAAASSPSGFAPVQAYIMNRVAQSAPKRKLFI